MRTSIISGGIAIAALSIVAAPAGATSPARGCANGHWQMTSFPLRWAPGDPVDPDGENLMIQAGIAGLVEAFGSLDQASAAFGYADFDGFYAGIADPNFHAVDKNGDGTICFKAPPATGHQPPYVFNTVDNGSNAP